MILDDLLAGLEGITMTGPRALEVKGLAYDSRRVAPGDAFFALPGLRHDGTEFLPQAWDRGAVAVVTAAPVEAPGRAVIRAVDPRRALAQAACRFHAYPSRALRVVGVTGTNGKTTITYLVESILRAAGIPPGVVGTTGVRIGGTTRPSAFTTPEAPELQALLREMADGGVRAVAMEVSSHALVQRRAYGVEFDVAAFTNLTQDHLDFHGTMDAYLDAKLMLFDGRNGTTSKSATAVVNAGDPRVAAVIAAARAGGMRVLTVEAARPGRALATEPDIAVVGLEPKADGLALRWVLNVPTGTAAGARRELAFHLPLLGRFNGENAAVAFGVAVALGIGHDAIVRGLESAPGVPGRLERVEGGQPFTVVVDYAHTPDALSRALEAVREHCAGRVLLVFGCGGDRDRGKRPIMGGIAAAISDTAWITNDNPRSEDPSEIAREIAAGDPSGRLRTVLDRRDAIAAALAEARPGDLVLIAGKGHETTQTLGERVLPFDDREVARALLRSRPGAGR